MRRWKDYTYFLSWAGDYYDHYKGGFVRTRTCGASIGHPEVDILWHALIDLWRQRDAKTITDSTYADCLTLIEEAYARVWNESCVQEQFELL